MRRLVLISSLMLLLERPGLAHPAWGIVVAQDGTIFFTDVSTNSVWRRTPDGRLTRLARDTHSHPLWLDRTGQRLHGEHVWWNARAARFEQFWWTLEPGGTVTRALAPPDTLRWPADSKGARYRVAGTRILRLDPGGTQSVVDGEPFAGLEHADGSINSLAVAPDDSLFVADTDHRCVWRVVSGQPPRQVHATGALWTPAGVAAAADALYVLEDRPNGPAVMLNYWEGPRVVRIGPGGTVVLVYVDERRGQVILGAATLVLVMAGLVIRVRQARAVNLATQR